MKRRCLNCMKEFGIPEGQEQNHFACPFCGYREGTPPKEITYLYPGTILQNRYIIGTTLGAGGFGITYKAWDTTLEMVVAIKEYYPAGMVQRVPGDPNLIVYGGRHQEEFYSNLERFLEEARKMAIFEKSKNIVHVENHFEANNTAYIVMEFLDGISVKEFMKQEGGKLDMETALEIEFAVSEALQEIHDASILHRDISPDNVFLCEGNKVKVLDFGAARLSDTEKEVTRSIILKPGFAPPEQYQTKSKQGPWTDIYALSAMLYYCITGVMPDESTNRKIEDTVVAPKELDPSIPDYISDTIMRGMAVNEALRFQNIGEFQKALLKEKKVVDDKTELKKRKRRRVFTIAAAVLLLAVGGFAAWRIYDSKDPVLNPATITVWVAYSGDEDADSAKQMMEDMSDMFQSDQAAVTVSVEAIPEEQYADRLEQAKADGTMPTVYQAEYASEEIQKSAASVKPVYNSMDNLSDYYFLKSYKKKLIEEKEVPLGFNIPVVYVRRSDTVDASSFELSRISDIQESQYYMDSAYADMLINTLGGSYHYENGLAMDNAAKELIQDVVKHTKSNIKLENSEKAMDGFANGTVSYYLASVRELQTFNKNVVGLYEMRSIQSNTLCGRFTDAYSISGSASKEEIAAARVWLRYMLEEGPQKTYHLVHRHAIPLQKDAYRVYVDNNSKLSLIDGYLDNLKFYPENEKKLETLTADLWKQVVLKRTKTIDEWCEEQK